MAVCKSLDEIEFVAALLCDVQTSHTAFTPRECRLTIAKLRKRYAREGLSLLTKTLPRLGKLFDRALQGDVLFEPVGWRKLANSKLPRFLGSLFNQVFDSCGRILPTPDVSCIRSIRQVLFVYYKYELPHTEREENDVIKSFLDTDGLLDAYNRPCSNPAACHCKTSWCRPAYCGKTISGGDKSALWIVEHARKSLDRLFVGFDPEDICPRHGPGSVSTSETGPEKYKWTCIPDRLAEKYPIDTYFYVSLGHVCDELAELKSLSSSELPAKVVLVPKDSRGPRLISEESLPMQYIQQGLMSAIVRLVENHPLTRENVRFTDQQPNQFAALAGSQSITFCRYTDRIGVQPIKLTGGRYATLDLKEASDRVSIGLVTSLFPDGLTPYLLAARSLCTVLPDGREVQLQKYAPMGSALCFCTLALTIWSLLDAAFTGDRDAQQALYVYGDDVIVPASKAEYAINVLETFGLKVNRDKSCTKGFFRESCGVDAYDGVDITPLRIKKVWRHARRAELYEAYIAYANELHRRGLHSSRDLITKALYDVYHEVPAGRLPKSIPHLKFSTEYSRPPTIRTTPTVNNVYYGREMRCWVTKPTRVVGEDVSGWMKLLRWFTEGARSKPNYLRQEYRSEWDNPLLWGEPFSVSTYTRRNTSMLVKRWRRIDLGPED